MKTRAILTMSLLVLFASVALAALLPVSLFTTASNSAIYLQNTHWCVNIEPVNGDFAVTDIDVNSVTMTSYDTGSVTTISADNKSAIAGDGNQNGIEDLQICFSKGDLNNLFSRLHGNKPKTVTVIIAGNLTGGNAFSDSLTRDVYPK